MATPLDDAAAVLEAARSLLVSAQVVHETIAIAQAEFDADNYDCEAAGGQRERMASFARRVHVQGNALEEIAGGCFGEPRAWELDVSRVVDDVADLEPVARRLDDSAAELIRVVEQVAAVAGGLPRSCRPGAVRRQRSCRTGPDSGGRWSQGSG